MAEDDSDSDSSEASEAFSKLTVPKLREAAEARGLDTSGPQGGAGGAPGGRREEGGGDEKRRKGNRRLRDAEGDRAASRVVMVRKMAAHGGRAIGTADKTASDIVSGAKRKAGAAEEKRRAGIRDERGARA